MKWEPKKKGEQWFVVLPATPQSCEVYRIGKDGTPLRFWNEKSAQIHADSLNPKTVLLD